MKEKKLPHNHDQNEEKILEKLPSVEECSQLLRYLNRSAMVQDYGYYGFFAIARNVLVILLLQWK